MSKKKIFLPILFFVFFIISCAREMMNVKLLSGYSDLKLNSITIEQIDEQKLLELIQELKGKIQGLKKDDDKEVDEIVLKVAKVVNLYKNYIYIEKVADYTNGVYKIPGETSVSVYVDTYCLNPVGAPPQKNEPYILLKAEPGIALFKEIMKYTNSIESVDKQLKQKLLWNLKNEVKFENLSNEEKILLTKIDPLAYLKVNNSIKNKVKDFLLGSIQEINQFEKATKILKGVAHSYEEYANNIESITSKEKMPEISGPIKADGYDIYTTIETESYRKAKIKFINMSNKEIIIEYGYFKPLRVDVQPLAFDLPPFPEKKLKDTIKKAFTELEQVSIDAYGRYTDKPFKLEKGDRWLIEEYPDRLLDFWKAFQDRNKAIKMTEKFCIEYPQFCNNKGHNDRADAFRHALWNALMQRDTGEFGMEIANAHELNDGNKEEIEMDRYNNEIGKEIGEKLKQNKIQDDALYYKEILKNLDRLRYLK